MMNNAFSVGECVFLRPIEPEDAPIVAACVNNPEVRVSYFTHTPISLHLQAERIRGYYQPGADYIPFVIALRESSTPIGVTAFHRVDLVSRAAVYSICISDPACWGHGYAGEVTSLMLRYGFDVLNLHRIQLHVWTGNRAAIKAYGKAGFVHEGVLRDAMIHNGEYCDFHVMGILCNEWRDAATSGQEPGGD